jgi:hypothetical protein
LLGVSLLSGLRSLFLPREYLMLIGISGRPAAIAWGVVFLSAHCLILVLMSFFLTYFGVAVLTEIANS